MSRSRSRRAWSEDDLLYLEEKWGVISIKGIAERLGRTTSAVQQKAGRIGLSDARLHFDGITVSQLSHALSTHYSILKNWVKLYDFPAKRRLFASKRRVLVVTYEDFWKWADTNRNMLDFSRLDRLMLGPEPDWVEEKRKADQLRKIHVPKPHNTPWSNDDDAKLKWMLGKFEYTYPQIASELQRTQGAVKRRIRDLGLKERPVHLPNHNKYTAEDEALLVEMLETGYCFEEIANRLNRSSLGVRGKAERMGYKFRNGVPYLENKEGLIVND